MKPAAASADTLDPRARSSVFSDLFKARLTALVLATTAVGFYMGSRGRVDLARLFITLAGTGSLACGAAALNQWLEREQDARMRRTQGRPLPSGRLQPWHAMTLGLATSGLGLGILWGWIEPLTTALGAVTLVSYLLVYTPLKRITPLNTVAGAVPGALPPLMGWSAAEGHLSVGGWALFAVLVFWQLPHFLAIAWMYRDDYARAGFAMLPLFDLDGRQTGAHALAHTVGLVAVSLSPFVLGLAGILYLAGALALGAFFLYRAWQFSSATSEPGARRLFLCSILYLPLLLTLMVLDKA